MRQSVSQSVPSVGSGGRQDQKRRHSSPVQSSPVVSTEKSASSHSQASSGVSSQSGQLCGVWLLLLDSHSARRTSGILHHGEGERED